jgi:hypothetical protein
MILLNKIRVNGFDKKVSVTLPLAGKDMSGTGSHTPRAETGDKAKEVNVSMMIRYIDSKDLKDLVGLAEAKNSKDERTIYNIVNNTANTMGIRQVCFDSDITVREDSNTEQWQISFKLIEYNSVAEKKQLRKAKSKIKSQTAKGTKVISKSAAPVDPNSKDSLVGFEKVLKGAEDKLK